MNEGELLVFVEVRYRKSNRFGSGAETVDYHKRRKLILAARHFLGSHQMYGEHDCRFDVISASPSASPVTPVSRSADMRIRWIKDAFQTD